MSTSDEGGSRPLSISERAAAQRNQTTALEEMLARQEQRMNAVTSSAASLPQIVRQLRETSRELTRTISAAEAAVSDSRRHSIDEMRRMNERVNAHAVQSSATLAEMKPWIVALVIAAWVTLLITVMTLVGVLPR